MATVATTAAAAAPPIRREEDGVIDDQHARWSRDLLNRADGGSFLFPPTQVGACPGHGAGQGKAQAAAATGSGTSREWSAPLTSINTHTHKIHTTQVTYHPAPVAPILGAAAAPDGPPSPTEPLTPLTPAQWVLQSHSVLGLCFHVDVEGAFTKPLKAYFVACSVLLVVFLSLRIQLGAWFISRVLVHARAHHAAPCNVYTPYKPHDADIY